MEDKVNKIDENMEHITRYFKYVTTDGESHTKWQLINENAKTENC